MEMETTTTLHTPYDILVRILSPLPAKSLLRIRWTCKYWFDLITKDTSFARMQIHHSIFSSYPSVLISSFRTGTNIKEFLHCHITDIPKGNLSDQVKILDPFDSPNGFRSLGTCHGLLFLYFKVYLRFYIWNPCTKEYKLIPLAPPLPGQPYKRNTGVEKDIYGFGYDSSIDDYIVIRILFFYRGGSGGSTRSDVHVYRLGTDTWTSIEPKYPYNLLPRSHKIEYSCYYRVGGTDDDIQGYGEGGVFVNGALYWIESSYRYDYTKIISFDILKETYQELSKQPECFNGCLRNLHRMRLQLFEGSLCLVTMFHNYFHGFFVEMWVMKDYSVNNNKKESSWTKLFKVAHSYDYQLEIRPLRLTNNGEILSLKNGGDFVLCDPKMREIRTLNSTLSQGRNSVAEVYTESLLSLNSGTYAGQD